MDLQQLQESSSAEYVEAIHKLRNALITGFWPPTHLSNALAITLLMTYHTRVSNSNAFANHLPTPIALRNLWTTPKYTIH